MKVPEFEEEVAVAAVRIVEDKLSPEEEMSCGCGKQRQEFPAGKAKYG